MKIFSHSQKAKNFPFEVKKLFEVFNDEIRLVGGSVRDLLLNRKVNDFDFTTKFLPDEITKILTKNKIKAVPTGVKFGTITAVLNQKNFEITTLRKDNETDGRHCEPEFVDDYFLDAQRRDFTVNALYLDSKGLVTDYFDGISDLKNKKVRFIGDAETRISEDYLRILRFFRFSCGYAQKLDVQGLKACVNQKENIKKLSRERIRAEFFKLLSSAKKENLIAILKVLKSKKIAQEIFSQKLDIKRLTQLFEIEKKLKFEASLTLKIAALFFDKNLNLEKFFKEIRATNFEKKYFNFLIQKKLQIFDLKSLKQLLAFEEKSLIIDLYLLGLAQNFSKVNVAQAQKNLKFLNQFSLAEFSLKGEDLLRLGFKGKKVGEMLFEARKFWAENDFKLKKSELVSFAKNMK
jgi:poly(A) polymerase